MLLGKLVLSWLGLMEVPGHIAAKTHTAPSWKQLGNPEVLREFLQSYKLTGCTDRSLRQPLGKQALFQVFTVATQGNQTWAAVSSLGPTKNVHSYLLLEFKKDTELYEHELLICKSYIYL